MMKLENTFLNLGLKNSILKSLKDLGYEKPSPIQAKCIPYLLSGHDLLGIAQTGSGKTAAFSLPFLNKINPELNFPQILILEPTRELAIQVTRAIVDFSKYMYNVNVLPIYGGQKYGIQLRSLLKGPQIIVGTPGRLLDHLKNGKLNLSSLIGLVLDEADEMLRMGFIEDVESIMMQVPENHQTALFSATMPEEIRRITRKFIKKAQEVYIKSNIVNRPNINQNYWIVRGVRKDEALLYFLEMETFDAAIIFVRTKNKTVEIAEILRYKGYNSAALNGDMNQILREQTLERLKDGGLDILIATDIAARGLDIERIDLVINYDIPTDFESYIHRIGRTGRAGRAGRAILFVEKREHRLLRNIIRVMKSDILEVKLPNSESLKKRRLEKLVSEIQKQLESTDLDQYRNLLMQIQLIISKSVEGLNDNKKIDIEILAAVLLKIVQKERSPVPSSIHFSNITNYEKINNIEMIKYRISVGRKDGIKTNHIISFIVNQGGIDTNYIGNIELFSNFSIIELSKYVPNELVKNLNKIHIMNKPINIKLSNGNYHFSNYKNKNSFHKLNKKYFKNSQLSNRYIDNRNRIGYLNK